MKIELHEIEVREIIEGFQNNEEEGIYGYHGKLNIRPKYQREFVYKEAQQRAVIDTVYNGFPLNVMYWVKTNDGNYELLDGQQRTLSICSFVNSGFGYEGLYYHNMTPDQQEKILSYKLMIYFCEGTDSEKLKWFETINIAGEKLTKQELRNAVYAGEWTNSAKKFFSKSNSPAYNKSSDYMSGVPIRQDYLETALKWISYRDNVSIEEYMARHQHDETANDLWLYFSGVIDWAKTLFPVTRKELKSVDWGKLYNEFKDKSYNSKELEERITKLMQDDDITKKSGVYPYLITGKEKYLNIRAFTPSMKRAAYEKQKGICPECKKEFKIEEMEADHIIPWSKGGHTSKENCQMLCMACNREKSDK